MDKAQILKIFFQTLGEASRLRIIRFIGTGERSVSEIVEELNLSQPLISHHLKALRENHILETKRQGPFIYYKLKDARLLDALGLILEIIGPEGLKTGEPMFCMPDWFRKNFNKR